MTAEIFLRDISRQPEHLSEKLLFGGLTKAGNMILATSAAIDLSTLKKIRDMISSQIEEMEDE